MDFYIKLTELYGQFRAVGVNYNQIVKILYRNFSEKKAAAYLFKLEQQTAQMVAKIHRGSNLLEVWTTKR